ncbi:NOP9 (YJL010C) [Zygosaccharomyces parabailii]|nr:NOP9 (YJL010C) [Zygosaccharomyces parabailii]CDH10580.1 probable Nucleolar protein 9 [Zygosaccharomyces bailii ISA1307]
MGKPRGRKLQKKQQRDQFEPPLEINVENEHLIDVPLTASDPQMFFGVLDREELEYFKQAEATLSIDAFESNEEKQHFVTSVCDELKGKEYKLVTSQICSKLVERLILECDDDQLKSIFKAFNGVFYNLSCHKYASHVLETLFVRGAALVEKELLTPSFDDQQDDEPIISMENAFLYMLNEIKPHLRSMVSHQYASHVLRLLILILASKNLPKTTQNNSTLRSKKSKIARKMIDIKDNDDFDRVHQTPESFKLELKELLKILYDKFTKNTVSRTDISPTLVTKFRELCVDPVASPVIQLIIQVEGIFDRERSFWRLVFSTTDEKDPKEESFVEYLLSDPVGSHFLENVISFARTKYVERLYNLYMKDRITKLAQRDTTGAFVVRALLKHLKNKEVKQILSALVPQLSILLNSNIDFGTSIIEASIQQNNFLRDEVISQLVVKYYPPQSDSKNILESCLLLSSSTLGNTRDDWPTAEERRRSLFLEQLIDYDRKFAEITVQSMLALPEERLLQMCYHGVFSHVVEHVLKPTLVDTIKRKLLLNVLCKDVVNMSCNAYGSHIVDKLWDFTARLTLYKERIANALNKEAEKVKNSSYGRQVWKNWHMEQYLRRRGDWKTLIKEQGFAIFPDAEPIKPKVNGPQNKRPYRSNLPPTKRRK